MTKRLLAMALALVATALPFARGQDKPDSDGPEWDRYAIILDRNVFDPNRKPERTTFATPAPTPAPAPETLRLTGVMTELDQALAFFEGSKVEGTVTRGSGQEIGGLRVGHIATAGVQMHDEATTLTVKVGQSLERPQESGWRIQYSASSDSWFSGLTQSLEQEDSDSEELSLLEKLKKRREKEKQQ